MTETFEQMALRVAREAGLSDYNTGLLREENFASLFAAAIRDELAKGAEPVAYMTTNDDGDPAMLFFDVGEALKYSGEDRPMNLFTCPPSAAARIAELEEELSAEKESCKLAHDDALRQVEHLGRSEAMISEFEAERDALRQEVERLKSSLTEWRSVFGHLGTADECGNEWNALISERDVLRRERDHWKANHDNRVAAAKVLLDRPDIPFERVHAYRAYVALQEQVDALRKQLAASQALITKAGEVMRERAISAASAINPIYGSGAAIDAISTVRIVTIDDLKGGAA